MKEYKSIHHNPSVNHQNESKRKTKDALIAKKQVKKQRKNSVAQININFNTNQLNNDIKFNFSTVSYENVWHHENSAAEFVDKKNISFNAFNQMSHGQKF